MDHPVDLVGPVAKVETIAAGSSLRDRRRLVKIYGPGNWKKRKGTARVRLPDGSITRAEVHWYEAHGIGRRELKVKRLLP